MGNGGAAVPTPRPPAARREEQHPATLTQLALERVKAVSGKPTDPLSMSKVLAGGLASATSAVFASHFGAFGTVGAAAAGSIATALAGWFYQRSIERAQDQVRSKVGVVGPTPLRAGARAAEGARAAIQARKPPRRPGTAGSSGSPRRADRLAPKLATATVLIFLFSLAVISGIEWARGSALSGAGATTVQEVLHRSASATHGSSERRRHTDEPTGGPAGDQATDGHAGSSGADDRVDLGDREGSDDPDGLDDPVSPAARGGPDGDHQPAPGGAEPSTIAPDGAGAAPASSQAAPAPNQPAPMRAQTAPAPNRAAPGPAPGPAPAPVGPMAGWPGPLGGLLTPPPPTPPPAPAGS
jgi:hypothetical protein